MLNRRWSFAAWFPFALASCAAAVYLFVGVDDGLPMAGGPGGGGEGIFFLIVSSLRVLVVAALVVCFFTRPRGDARNRRAVVISTVVWVLIFMGAAIVYRNAGDVTVHVRAVDTTGRPLPGVQMDYRWSKRRLPLMPYTEDRGTVVADASGTATFRVPAFDTLYVHGHKMLRPTHEVIIYGYEPSTFQIQHTKDGSPGPDPYSANVPKASELNLSMEFDPPTSR